MLKFAEKLSDDFEYAVIVWGQSNGRPWGTQAQGFSEAPHLSLEPAGINLAITAGYTATAGASVSITTSTDVGPANRWKGTEIRLGTSALPVVGYGTVTSHTTFAAGSAVLTVTWNADFAAAAGATSAWLHRVDTWKNYATVRVLAAYLPEAPGAYPAGPPVAPGYTFPAAITSYEDAGLFLPFTFLEGLEGPGASGTATGSAATTLTDTGATWTVNLFGGGYVRAGSSYARIATNTGTALTLTAAGWTGGTPSATAAYEIHVGHWKDNPYHHSPGYGFRYPLNDPQPTPFSTEGKVHNRPRGYTGYGYGNQAGDPNFGAMLPGIWRLANMIGKRINVIHLAINSSSQVLRSESNNFGFQGVIGWWDDNKFLDWTPANPTGNAARLRKMVETMAPAALLAEGNTKPLKILAIYGPQGEGDALTVAGRSVYKHTLSAFYSWLRKVIVDADMSPYASGVKVPVVHPKILHTPYELAGTVELYPGIFITLTGDSEGLVNAAIEEQAAKDGYFATFEVDDHEVLQAGDLHFNGVGEAKNGVAFADAMGDLINKALSRSDNGPFVLDICNEALSHIGDEGGVTSIDDTTVDSSTQAALCTRFYARARDNVLAMHEWSMATLRVALVAITNTRTEYGFAYAVPSDLLKPIRVLPPGATDDNNGAGTVVDATRPWLPLTSTSPSPPVDITIERDADGVQVLYTDQEDAELSYIAQVTDSSLFPPLFRSAVALNLASLMVGSIVKGDEGRNLSKKYLQEMMGYLGAAAVQDSANRKVRVRPSPPWTAGRR